jgi:hypothetical protein
MGEDSRVKLSSEKLLTAAANCSLKSWACPCGSGLETSPDEDRGYTAQALSARTIFAAIPCAAKRCYSLQKY